MKRFLLILISSCVMLAAYAQEEIHLNKVPEMLNEAGSKLPIPEKPLLFDDSFSITRFSLTDNSLFNQPLIPNYIKNLDFTKYLGKSIETGYTSYPSGSLFSPYLTSVQVFNQSMYKLNSRFSFGGNSFGAQSIFDPPRMNQTIQDMSIKGASMILQYKVSDKIKVQTRVSISTGQSPWEP
jgi:hypothetical protein